MPDQNQGDSESPAAPQITPELVHKIADKVLALLREDLKLIQERQGFRPRPKSRHKGIR